MGRSTSLGNRTGPTFGVKRPRRPQWNRPPEVSEKKRKFSKQLAPSGSIHATRESNWTHIWRETPEKVAVEQTTRTPMGRSTPLGNRTGPTFGVKRPRRPQWNRPPEVSEKKRKFSKQLAPSGSIHATRESNWTHIWRETPEKAAVEQTTRNQMKKTEIFETASPEWVDSRHSGIELDPHLA
ncbi:hypothetical protein KIN20_037397 [Parelaphostrongylus tenuis]|uniref:Uncharacterized protein n=1 Tax=Parelaphostrongylus tenuis TaxID=148309 RepID=A0AAD5WMF5_PARTN|nr:hypothetical protein KIN20_037397 [Parelaphostrongylus tenuis]